MPTIRRWTAACDMRAGNAHPAALRHRRRSKALTCALCIVLLAGLAGQAAAQGDASRISVAAAIVAEPASQVALSIQVGPRGSLPNNSFVRIRGLPASVSLTEGYAIAPGSWAVPLFGLASLRANVPAGVSGRSEIIVHLVAMDGTTLAEARTALIVGPAAIIAQPEKAVAEPPPKRPSIATAPAPPAQPAIPAPAELAPREKERAERFVSLGDRHLEQGNISAARMFYQRAAEAGLAGGAIKLATTYDPGELERLNVKVEGVVADRTEARKWYERARALGAPEAEGRLARLGGR
jgi:hypothetical protein